MISLSLLYYYESRLWQRHIQIFQLKESTKLKISYQISLVLWLIQKLTKEYSKNCENYEMWRGWEVVNKSSWKCQTFLWTENVFASAVDFILKYCMVIIHTSFLLCPYQAVFQWAMHSWLYHHRKGQKEYTKRSFKSDKPNYTFSPHWLECTSWTPCVFHHNLSGWRSQWTGSVAPGGSWMLSQRPICSSLTRQFHGTLYFFLFVFTRQRNECFNTFWNMNKFWAYGAVHLKGCINVFLWHS